MKNYKKTIIITTLVTLLPILLGVILWEKLPDSIATHWGADGQASAGQLTPRFLPLSLSNRLLQVTVTISPSAAKGASNRNGFLRASDRKVPADKCRISKDG